MYVSKLRLYNFRNYQELNLKFCDNWNILIGDNGVGKTNILEAIYYASTTRSPRNSLIKDLININSSNSKFAITLDFNQQDILHRLEHKYFYKDRKSSKSIKLNSKKISVLELLGKIPFVYFVPEDLNIIKGEAKLRRKLLDFILFQIYPNYKYLLSKYNKILKERNALLRAIYEGKTSSDMLNNWDDMLAETCVEIYLKRKNLVEILNNKFSNKKHYKIFYKSFFNGAENLDKENLVKSYKDKLQENRTRDIKYKITFLGIHRDNLSFLINSKSLKKFGSQGQQRFFMLNLKILIAEIIFDFTKENPILIFDDVFSELDINKIKELIYILDDKYQVFVSSVSIDGFSYLFDRFEYKKIFDIGSIGKAAGECLAEISYTEV